MKVLGEGIYNFFKANPNHDLYKNLGGRLYRTTAKSKKVFPYCVYYFAGTSIDKDFSTDQDQKSLESQAFPILLSSHQQVQGFLRAGALPGPKALRPCQRGPTVFNCLLVTG